MALTLAPDRVRAALHRDGLFTVLTGAGISAESGIPTFRGPEGFWSIGSRNYHGEEMATRAMFLREPLEVWAFYLHRYAVCRKAEPNLAHRAVRRLEDALGDRFRLVSQNVDGLHQRAGSSEARSSFIHGSLAFARCSGECSSSLVPFPDLPKEKGERIDDAERRKLRCTRCGTWLRPHILWFDESYDEAFYKYETVLGIAARTAVLLVVGTTGATTLPNLVVDRVAGRGGLIVDVNPHDNPFGHIAETSAGVILRARATEALPDLVEAVVGYAGAP